MYAAFYCHSSLILLVTIRSIVCSLPLSGFLGAKPISGVQRGHSAPSVEPTTTLSEACSYSGL